MEPIRVPRPPKTAFNKNRPVSDLLKAQIAHFQHLEAKLAEEHRSPLAAHELTTESTAAQYIAHMTRVLCDSGRNQFVTAEQASQEKRSKPITSDPNTRDSRSKNKSASKRRKAETKSDAGSERSSNKKATKRASKKKNAKSTHAKRKRAAKS
ncbi:MAG TPA: hypothetical protein VGC88_03385 [Terriglobales bacterium]|jgi:hypothetical protein